MKTRARNFIIGSAIGMFLLLSILSSAIYGSYKRETRRLNFDFSNWGEEFIDD